nr:hypothetical protein GCM10020063_025220 [Dactylosporangium thailandense]
MRREWVVDRQMRPGAVLFEWDRPFSLWGYSGSHSQLLFRSVKYDPDTDADLDAWPRTRVDLLFKPVDALYLRRLSYPTLRVRVATEPIAEEILGRMSRSHGDEKVLELVGPDGIGDHIVCLATGFCEDDGEYWEPSPFAADLSDGRTPPWRLGVLGGGPDGELTARYASVQELATAVDAGDKGRWLYVVQHGSEEENRPGAVAAFLTRHEAERRVQELHDRRDGNRAYWVDAVPIDL